MSDQKPAEPIIVDASTQTAQAVRPANAVPQAPRNPLTRRYIPAPTKTIAPAANTQGDTVEQKQIEPDGYYYPLYGVTSFAEWEALQATQQRSYEVQELTSEFQCIVSNIMADTQIINKDIALNRLLNEFTSRLNAAKQAKQKPSLFKQLYQALTGKAEKIEPDDQPVTEDELRKAAKEAPFQVWQTKEGTYRWFAIYSNQFRDEDHPPEIISEASHKGFIELVSRGVVDYPELWHWHVDGTAWGKADVLDYVEGFALAAGYVYPGHEQEAKALSEMDDIRVSHGMPSRFIVRNPDDPSIIEFHVTSEISPLPGWAAANPLTEFVVL